MRFFSTVWLFKIAIWGRTAVAQTPASCKQQIYGGMTLVDWEIDPHFVYFPPENDNQGKRGLDRLVADMRASLNTTLSITSTNYTNFKNEKTSTLLNNMLDSNCSMELSTVAGYASVSKLWNMLLNSLTDSRLSDFTVTQGNVSDSGESLLSLVLPRHVQVLVYRPGSNAFQVPRIEWNITCPITASTGVGMKEEMDCSRCASIKEDLDGICRMPRTFKELNDMGLYISGIWCKEASQSVGSC
jgi:hypothetical protein